MKFKKTFFFWVISASTWLSTCGVSIGEFQIETPFLHVRLQLNGKFSVHDKRTGTMWHQIAPENQIVKSSSIVCKTDESILLRLKMIDGHEYTLSLELDRDRPELTVSLSGEEMPEFLAYPYPFQPAANADFLLAFKSGLLMPVMDNTIFFKNNPRDNYQYYEGHNSSMPFYGLINSSGDGMMRLVETPNDAGYLLLRHDGRLINQMRWQPEFGKVGYPRRVRYIFFDRGGHVAMADRFRSYAEKKGMVKTLREKKEGNPDVDKLVGAAVVWLQDYDKEFPSVYPVAKEMANLGMTRVIFNTCAWWNNMSTADIKKINELGYLTGRYDLYQDAIDPAVIDKLGYKNPSWIQEAWPHDMVVNKDGSFFKGWDVIGYDGLTYYCGRVTEMSRMKYARDRISEELNGKPYTARFIDTEAASDWAEDWHPDRMMTRTQCRARRMELLDYVKYDAGLVTGTEGLQCFVIPSVDYFEGGGPVEPFRPPWASGQHPFTSFGPEVQLDPMFANLLHVAHRYLVPLWCLVFSDCAVVYPRWDEHCNKYADETWVTIGNLQKILSGRPPLFTIPDAEYWQKPGNQDLIAGIYHEVAPIARATGYARMINHEFLTPNRDVQRTTFDNDIVVTVNFGDERYHDEFCGDLDSKEYRMTKMK